MDARFVFLRIKGLDQGCSDLYSLKKDLSAWKR